MVPVPPPDISGCKAAGHCHKSDARKKKKRSAAAQRATMDCEYIVVRVS